MVESSVPRIVVLGAGFGGLEFCKHMANEPCEITVIDRQNHHLFQPLLYQVATAALALPDIAEPIRKVLGKNENVTVLMDEIVSADLEKKEVTLKSGSLNYDYLVVAVGATNNYFGNDHWAEHAMGLKSLKEAFDIRQRVLGNLEKAELETDPEKRKQLMTIAIVGGGPAGVEMAGALAELTKIVVRKEFRNIDPDEARILIFHSRDRVLNYFPDPLPVKAQASLEKKGVEIHLNSRVSDISTECVKIGDKSIKVGVVIWTAGVAASAVTKQLNVALDKGGRITVEPDGSVPKHPEVFGVGDCISLKDANGVTVPGVSPGAIQMAKHVASIIRSELREENKPRPPFEYFDKGMMATIGRSSAVVALGNLRFCGFFAWVLWLFIHILYLVGFRNKASVVLQWGYAYLNTRLGARIMLEPDRSR